MSGVNKVILVGFLGSNPDTKHTPSGATVCQFSLATNETWKNKAGEKQEKTTWHTVVCWNKLAELAGEYLSKGRQAYVEGKLITESWEDKETKKTVYRTKIQADTIQFLGSKGDSKPASDQKEQPGSAPEQSGFTEDDIPL